ncbi:M20/M25/M40 family metallo-hydrolase [Jiella sp. MQZ9-1]|uniref:M20/M25/M40 family metallo-hydrolase n=1 Tax=Jiella flava TaxID=2816857 RepID=A0A939JT21_9HYPH|nr:M20/M25/M40 family metallo-hydrolase [Jiella flava]MBO0663528.1 M20/M25/M40 family metallo-hydrolase [Jiella flava]MCD2472103.1 M20/M25/M40 family metallo-hydrolase [Jiella flava]
MNLDLLKRLCETPGVPGREHRVRALIEEQAKGLFDEIRTDALGSLICTRKGKGDKPQKLLLLCHMDEIGFLVSHITDKGFVHVDPVGGFDPRNLFSRRVLVCTDNGDIKGVMNAEGKPIHIQSPEERKKMPEPNQFVIDTGLGAAAKDKIKIGDYVVMNEPFEEMGEKIVSKALDNRIACWLGLEAVRKLVESEDSHDCELTVAFTAQEEVGLRGAKTASFGVAPDIVIGVDTTLACDTPGVPEKDRTTVQGEGFGLHIKDGSFIADIGLVKEIEALAGEKKIACQRTILARGGQDGAAGQQAGAGARAVGIVVGTRYIHTVAEMIDTRDLKAARKILTAFIAAH